MPDPAEPLFGLPLEDFVAERDALARRLRAAGDRGASQAVKALRKPAAPVWAVNQLARTGETDELLAAAAALRDAQAAALAGRAGGAELRDAAVAERAAVEALVARARELRPAGKAMTRAMIERVRAVLHAAARDPEVADAIRRGRLENEPQEGQWAWGPAADARNAVASRKGQAQRKRELREAREERTRLRGAADRAAARCAEAADEVERARAALAAAEERAAAAQREFDEARARAADAEARVEELARGD